jgi:endo-1,3-1,4-beta-glycanase ExoK
MKIYVLMVFMAVNIGCSTQRQKITFHEDFNGTLADSWTIENHTFENNLAQFVSRNAKVENHKLVLTLTDQKAAGKNFSGAEVRTNRQFLFGKFTARLKASSAEGCISAFFLYQPNTNKNHEIDIEISGKYPTKLSLNHWVNNQSNNEDFEMPFNTSQGFHNYEIDWQPKKITWRVDGTVVYTTTHSIPKKPMQLIFNLWATKSVKWAGEIKNAKLPAKFEIETFNFVPYKKQP